MSGQEETTSCFSSFRKERIFWRLARSTSIRRDWVFTFKEKCSNLELRAVILEKDCIREGGFLGKMSRNSEPSESFNKNLFKLIL